MTLESEINAPPPSREEWLRLHQATAALKEAAPWEWLYEEDIFAIRDPETGELGFCSLTGNLGEHLALIVYRGVEGLGGYLEALETIENAAGILGQWDAQFTLLEVAQLQVSFEDRDTLAAEDREVLKSLGLRFRGRQAWPWFRQFNPGRTPWAITSPQARFLATMVEQTLVVTQALEESEPLLRQFEQTPEDEFLVRTVEDGTWTTRWERLEAVRPTYQPVVDEAALAEVRRTLRQEPLQLQIHLGLLPTGVEAGPLPPYFPYALLAVDAKSGTVLGHDLLLAQPSVKAMLEELPMRLVALFKRLGSRPHAVQVVSPRLYSLLAVPLGQLGIALSQKETLPALEEAFTALQNFIGQGV